MTDPEEYLQVHKDDYFFCPKLRALIKLLHCQDLREKAANKLPYSCWHCRDCNYFLNEDIFGNINYECEMPDSFGRQRVTPRNTLHMRNRIGI
jgi:hypothetical protein